MQTALTVLGLGITALAIWSWFEAVRISRRFPPTGDFAPVRGGRLHLHDLGPRDAAPHRTIVMLHGASGNLLAMTLPLAGQLAARHRVIAIDRPGHGHSDRTGGREAASVTVQARRIGEAMDAIGAPRAIIVAHSFAGAVALTMALDEPERVAGLVLLSPVSHPWPGGITWYYHAASWPIIGPLFSRLLPVPGAWLWMEPGVRGVFAPQTPPDRYAEKTALPLLLRPGSFEANAQDVAGLYDHVVSRADRYGGITAPTVIISGDQDSTVYTHIHTASLARELPDVRSHVLAGVGHAPHHAATELVVAEIEALSERLHSG